MKIDEWEAEEMAHKDMFAVLDTLSTAWYGETRYFWEGGGCVYNRESGKMLSIGIAINEFAKTLRDDGE